MSNKLKFRLKKSVSFLVSFLLIVSPYYPLLQINRPALAEENIPTLEDTSVSSPSAEPPTEPVPELPPVVAETQSVDIINNSGDQVVIVAPPEEATPSVLPVPETPTPEIQPSGTENPSQPIEQPNASPQEPSQTNPTNPESQVLSVEVTNSKPETPSLKVVESTSKQKNETDSFLGNVVNGLLSFVGLLNTDKPDYAPTDTATITGSNLKPDESYTLIVSSSDEPAVHFETAITTDSAGTFVYAYQLDGNYRPNYKVEIRDLKGEVVATTTFTDGGAKINKLYSNSGLTNEQYQFAVGNTVYVQATNLTTTRGYKLEAKNASGTSAYLGACKTGSTTATDSYAPTTVSGSTDWTWVLHEWDANDCSSGSQGEDADNIQVFNVAQATAYTASSLSTTTTTYATGATAYVVINGLNRSQNDWEVTWIKPDTSSACANTGGGDRPDSTSSGVLPDASPAYLEYPASTGSNNWNDPTKYDGACPAFASGNVGAWKLTLTDDSTHSVTLPVFTVVAADTTPPSTTDSGIDGNWHNTNVTVTLTCTDNVGGSGCASTYHTTDGSTPTTGSSTTNPFTLSSNGDYTIKYFSKDVAGNSESVKTATNHVKIDKTNPTDPTTLSSTSHTTSAWSSDSTVDVTWAGANDGSGSGVDGFYTEWNTSPASIAGPVTKEYEETASTETSPSLATGQSHYFHIATLDNAGNWTSTAHVGPFWVDTTASTAPGTPSTTTPTNNLSQTWNWSAADDPLSGILMYLWRVVDGPSGTTSATTVTTNLGEGIWSFFVGARDNAGNDGPEASSSATVDVTAPQLTKAETLDRNSNGRLDGIKLTFSENIDDSRLNIGEPDGWDVVGAGDEQITTGDVSNDNILVLTFGEGPTPDTGNTPTVTYTPAEEGSTHDLAGNELGATEVTTTDTALPVLLSAFTKDVNINGRIDGIELTFSENINDSQLNVGQADGWDVAGYSGESIGTGTTANDNKLLLSFNEGNSNDTGNTPSLSYTPSEGPVSTHDLAGNELSSYSGGTSDGAAPVTTIGSPAAQSYHNSPIRISGSSSDSNGQGQPDTVDFVSLYYQLKGNESWTEISGSKQNNNENSEPFAWAYNWTPSSDGTYNIKVEATDRAGNVEQSPTVLGVVYDTVAPATTDSGIDTNWHNTDITVTLTCTDSAGGSGCTNTYHTTDGTTPTTSSSTTNPFTITPDGTYTIKYFSKDNAGNSEAVKTATDTVKIDKTNPAKPAASPAGGDYLSEQSVLLSSTDSPSGIDSIYYTTDDSDPSKSSSFFSPGLPVKVSKSLTLKAIAYDKAGNKSEIMTETYGIAPTISSEGSVLTSATSATVTWGTDNLSTSRVIYDTVSHASLGSAPNYGYANSTGETDTSPKVTSHSVTVTGLTAATTYYYRGVSRGSPETVGDEKSFTLGAGVVAGAATGPATSNFGVGEILGSEKTTTEKESGQNKILGEQVSATPATPIVNGGPTQENQPTNNYWWLLLLGLIIGGGGYFYFVKKK